MVFFIFSACIFFWSIPCFVFFILHFSAHYLHFLFAVFIHFIIDGDNENCFHFDDLFRYINAISLICSWEGNTDFLQRVDNSTTPLPAAEWMYGNNYKDVSQGMTVLKKYNLMINYILNNLNGKNGLIVIDNGLNTGKINSSSSNYFDNYCGQAHAYDGTQWGPYPGMSELLAELDASNDNEGSYFGFWYNHAGGNANPAEIKISSLGSPAAPVICNQDLEKIELVDESVILDLNSLFVQPNNDTMSFSAKSEGIEIGAINNGVWTYNSQSIEVINITFKAVSNNNCLGAYFPAERLAETTIKFLLLMQFRQVMLLVSQYLYGMVLK